MQLEGTGGICTTLRTMPAQTGKVIPVTRGLGSLLKYMNQSKQRVPEQLMTAVQAVRQNSYCMCLHWGEQCANKNFRICKLWILLSSTPVYSKLTSCTTVQGSWCTSKQYLSTIKHRMSSSLAFPSMASFRMGGCVCYYVKQIHSQKKTWKWNYWAPYPGKK